MTEKDPDQSTLTEHINDEESITRLENTLVRTIGRLFGLSQGSTGVQNVATQYLIRQEGWEAGKGIFAPLADIGIGEEVKKHVVDRLVIITLLMVKSNQHTLNIFRGYSRGMESWTPRILNGLIKHREDEQKGRKNGELDTLPTSPQTVEEAIEILFGKPDNYPVIAGKPKLAGNTIATFVNFIREECGNQYKNFVKNLNSDHAFDVESHIDVILREMADSDMGFLTGKGRPAVRERTPGDSSTAGKDFSYVIGYLLKRNSAKNGDADPLARMFDALRSRLAQRLQVYAPVLDNLRLLLERNPGKLPEEILEENPYISLLVPKLPGKTLAAHENEASRMQQDLTFLLGILTLVSAYNERHREDSNTLRIDLRAWAASQNTKDKDSV